MSTFIWQPGMTLASVEKVVISQALRFHRGKVDVAASALDISARELTQKIETYKAHEKEQERLTNEQRKRREEFLQRSRGVHTASPVTPGVAGISGTDAGLPVEPTPDVASEPSVSVSERKEVQGVLPRKTSQGRSRKARY